MARGFFSEIRIGRLEFEGNHRTSGHRHEGDTLWYAAHLDPVQNIMPKYTPTAYSYMEYDEYGGFQSHRGTPSHHPFLVGDFP